MVSHGGGAQVNTYAVALAVGALILSVVLTGVVRRFALARGILDVPNERSSHTTATPRGGGIAVVVTTSLAILLLALSGRLGPAPALALLVGGLAVAAVGFLDDRRTLRAGVRLLVQVLAALWAVACIGGLG